MRVVKPLILCLAGLAAAGCNATIDGRTSVRKQLGLAQDAPDEFVIVARNPIEIPEKFELERPRPGAPSRVEVDPLAQAHEALFNTPETPTLAAPSEGEEVLLRGADLEEPTGDIRATLAEETEDNRERRFGLDSLFGVPIPKNFGEAPEDLDSVDEVEELRRKGLPAPAAPPPPEEPESGTLLSLDTTG